MKALITRHSRLIKFIISGGTAAVVEYGLFALFNALGVPLVIANTLSFIGGLLVSFSLNRTWVFLSKERARRQFGLYVLLALINLVIGNTIIFLLHDGFGVYALVAKLIVMVLIASWNYLIFSRFIFKPSADKE